jgi:hypothetical protein
MNNTIQITPTPGCRHCGGSGEVIDYVPYGNANVPMLSMCDCVTEQVPEDKEDYDIQLIYPEDDLATFAAEDFATQQEIAREEEEIEQWCEEYNEPPKPLDSPNLDELENLCKKYLAAMPNNVETMRWYDYMEDQIFAKTLETFFGPDIHDWITSQMTDD